MDGSYDGPILSERLSGGNSMRDQILPENFSVLSMVSETLLELQAVICLNYQPIV